MKREYKIARTDLGWSIYKKRERNGILQMWFLSQNDAWKLDKRDARVFYHKEDALSALVIMRKRDGQESD